MASDRQSSISGTAWPLACAATVLVWLLARLTAQAWQGPLTADADAYYTIVIARNWVEHGLLSFDGQTLTNGFSPLWLAALAAQRALVGGSLTVTFALEAAMLATSLFILLCCLNVSNRLFQVAFTGAFAWLAAGFAMTGLDASLLVFCISLFVASVSWKTESLLGGLALAATAILCAATRLEAVLFVIPALVLAPTRMANRVLAVSLFLAALVADGALNLRYIGVALPVTSEVHAIGGLQLNRALLSQIVASWGVDGFGARPIVCSLALLAAPAFGFVARRNTTSAALGAGAGVGGWLVLLGLTLGSSWTVGAELGATAIWSLIALFWVVAPPLSDALQRLHERLGSPSMAQPAVAGLAGLVLAALLGQSAMAAGVAAPRPLIVPKPADPISILLKRHGATINSGRIAMGFGAGALAAASGQSVIALEGVAGDRAYLTRLVEAEDLTPMLCGRNVKFVAAYLPELATYGRHAIDVLDPSRSRAKGATVEIDYRDQVAKIPTADGRQLYVWRLGACWRNGYAPALS